MTWPSSRLYRHLVTSARSAAQPFNATPRDHAALLDPIAAGRITEQFDAVIHVDRSTALVPLGPSPHWYHEEVPETYPSGL